MIVGKHMTQDPVVIGPDDFLSLAQEKMARGNFRRLPVVKDSKLIGIVTDRDMREHHGFYAKTKVNAAMTENPVMVAPGDTIEHASQLLLKHKIGGLPVVEDGKLIGIITTSDLLRVFLDVLGASDVYTLRLDITMGNDGCDLAGAAQTAKEHGTEIVSLGTHSEKWGTDTFYYLRVRSTNPGRLVNALKQKGYNVVGVHV